MAQPIKIMLISGESSGDAHAAYVVRALKKQNPAVDCFGIGGPKMQAEGCRLILDSKSIAVMGVFEVIKHFRAIKQAWNLAVNALEQERPDCVILVDYPGFNLRFAEKVKALGIKILYYVSPQIWAWKKGRIHKIKRLVDHMAVILPFEEHIYQNAGVPVTFVGSPLLEQITLYKKKQVRDELQLSEQDYVVGLMPGSREAEIAKLMPVLASTAEILKRRYTHLRFVVPLADNIDESEVKAYFAEYELRVTFVKHVSHKVMAMADLLIGSSGTATLEAAIFGTPMVVIYKMNALTFAIAKHVVKVPFISLPNILAQKRIYPELIQEQANPAAIANTAAELIENPEKVQQMKIDLKKTVQLLGKKGAGQKVAEIALSLCDNKGVRGE